MINYKSFVLKTFELFLTCFSDDPTMGNLYRIVYTIALWVEFSKGQEDKLWAAVGTSIGGVVNLIVVVPLTKWICSS